LAKLSFVDLFYYVFCKINKQGYMAKPERYMKTRYIILREVVRSWGNFKEEK